MGKDLRAIGRLLVAAVVASASVTWPPAPARQDRPAPITPLPPPLALPPAKVRLGEALFNDVRLSGADNIACASCHRLDLGGGDARARSEDADGHGLDFNAPTIFNAALNFRFNWRGNFRNLEDQNEAVLRDRRLMNTDWNELLAKLRADPEYRHEFESIYEAAPDREAVLDALAAYQRSLTTPNARFDRYLRGESDAITAEERQGYQLFEGLGCIACHQGANVGGNLFQRFGIFENPYLHDAAPRGADLGRFTITGDPADRYVFRVPSLRNVRITGPYFHDGRTSSLEQAVEIMGRSQLGRELTEEEVRLIVAFLGSLTGELAGKPLEASAKLVQ